MSQPILIISGTNRPNSRTLQVARFYLNLLKNMPQDARVLDLAALPPQFASLVFSRPQDISFLPFQQIIDSSQKIVFVVPEYNGSFPGALKTFLDLMRYPDSLRGKTTALVGLGSGVQGGVLALSHLTDIFHYMGAKVIPEKVRLSFIDKHLSDGIITDPLYLQLLQEQAKALVVA